jgi:hypothetical protein
MVFIMQKDQINVNEHGHKPSRKLLDQISDRLRVKGYLPRTEEAYRDWAKRYVLFFDKRYPKEMGSTEIEEFISCLALKKNLSGSTQNQQTLDW